MWTRGAIARALTRHDRAIAVLERVDDGCADATRGRDARDDARVGLPRGHQGAEVGAPKGGRKLLDDQRVLAGHTQTLVDLSPLRASLQDEQRRHLGLKDRGRLGWSLVVEDRRKDDGHALVVTGVYQSAVLCDEFRVIPSERRRGIREALLEVNDDQDRPPAKAGGLPKSSRFVKGIGVLSMRTHAVTMSPGMLSASRTRRCASSPGSSGDQRSGTAGVGGSRPVSALQFARTSASGGP